MKNFYEVLRVRTNATEAQIRKSYREMITKFHPDIYRGDKDYAARYTAVLTEAYATLRDPERRRIYDEKHNISSAPNLRQLRREDKEIKRAIKEENRRPKQNYEQQVASQYFRNAETKKQRKNIFVKIFGSKLFYALLIVLLVEAAIFAFLVMKK